MASPKTVLFINRVYPPHRGASGRILKDLARRFVAQGWDVTILCAGPKIDEDETDGKIQIKRCKGRVRYKSVYSYGYIWLSLFIAALFSRKHTLVVTMTDPPLTVVIGWLLSKIKRSRHIHWCQDLYPDLFPYVGLNLPGPIQRLLKKSTRRCMKTADKIIVIGRCMARHLTQAGIEPNKIAVIPNWPDYEIVDPSKATGEHKPFLVKNPDMVRPADKQVRDDSPKFRVLYAGNLGRMHPVQSIIDAAYFLQEYPEIEFCMVGDGPNYDRLAEEKHKRGIHNMRFLPYQPQKQARSIMESGDVHLVSLHEDASGLLVPSKFYAAMAVGRPVIFIGPDNNEITTVLNDYQCGLVVPPKDAPALVEAILYYRMQAENWFSAAQGAREAGKVFTPDHAIEEWIKRAADTLEDMF